MVGQERLISRIFFLGVLGKLWLGHSKNTFGPFLYVRLRWSSQPYVVPPFAPNFGYRAQSYEIYVFIYIYI